MSLSTIHPIIIAIFCLIAACKSAPSGHATTKSEPATPNSVAKNQTTTPGPHDYVVEKSTFKDSVTSSMLAIHNLERQSLKQWRSDTCAKTEAIIQRIVTRLVTRSGLEKIIEQQPNFTLAVACKKHIVALPELRGGVLWIYPDIIRGLKTEDHLAALLAHEIIHYTRSHEEERLSIIETWMPFRESAVNRARWSQEQEADRLSLGLLTSAGFDPHAAADVPLLLDKFLAQETNWKEGQLDVTFGTMSDRSNRVTAELKYRRVRPSPQTPGEVATVMAELNAR